MPPDEHPTADPPAPPVLAAVYREHVGFVWRALRRFGVDAGDVEDVAHEVFMTVRDKLPEFDGDRPLRPWLYAIARGSASNYRRGRARARARVEAVANCPHPVPEAGDPVAALARREAHEFVARFVEQLPEPRREVFALGAIEGMRAGDIASALGLDVEDVYVRMRAARRAFATAAAARFGEGLS